MKESVLNSSMQYC